MASVIEMTELFSGQQPPPVVTTNNQPTRRFISVDFLISFAKIIVTVCVLVASPPHEHATTLLIWIIGYLFGSILLLGWRLYTRNNINHVTPIESLVEDYYNLALHCFFGGWFIFGCIVVFGADSSLDRQAHNLYWLAVALLMFSSIGYAMPFIFCVARCCLFPCFFLVRDSLPARRATEKSIRSLPTYKFQGTESGGGVVNQRLVDPENAVCPICLENYENNNDLKELPCGHIFHVDCVDRWLKMNAACPICNLKSGKRVGCWCWVFG